VLKGQRLAPLGVVPVVSNEQRGAFGSRQPGVAVARPEDVDLNRVDACLDRGGEALQRVAGRDQVGTLVANQAQPP
jgi:hypothetical protein